MHLNDSLFVELQGLKKRPEEVGNNFIFTYWHDGFHNSPDIVKVCYWFNRIQNPDKSLIFLDDKLIAEISEPLATLRERITLEAKNAHIADFIRMYFILRYGGAWVDTSCITSKPLKTWLDPILLDRDFYIPIAYDFPDRQVMNWFMAGCGRNDLLFDIAFEWLKFFLQPRALPLKLTFAPEKHVSPLNIGRTTTGRAALGELEAQGLFPYFVHHYLFNILYNENVRARQALDTMPKPQTGLLKLDRRKFSDHSLILQSDQGDYLIDKDGIFGCELLPLPFRERLIECLANESLLEPHSDPQILPV